MAGSTEEAIRSAGWLIKRLIEVGAKVAYHGWKWDVRVATALFLVWSASATADQQNDSQESVGKSIQFLAEKGKDSALRVVAAANSPVRKDGGPSGSERKGKGMITAVVQFKLPQPVTRDKAREMFLSTAPKYRDVHGLVRKYYILSEDGGTAGGIYLWRSRADAERLYTDAWKKFIVEKYGAQPSVQYFSSPVIVDNLTGEISKDE